MKWGCAEGSQFAPTAKNRLMSVQLQRLLAEFGGSTMIRNMLGAMGLLVTGVCLAMAAPAAHADDWSKTYAVSGRADVHVQTDDGSVTITSADQKDVYAHVMTSRYRIPDDVHIEESQNGDTINIHVRAPHFNWGFWGHGGSIRVELRVPRELNLDVNTGDGNVTAQPVSGSVRINTGDGNISANGIKGDIYMHSGDGHIEASELDGTLKVDTGDGHVTVGGRFDSLDVRTGDGNIDASAMSGSKIVGGWNLHSGDGRINLRVPGDLSADLDAHTGDGSITVDMEYTTSGSLGHSTVRGKMNGGGGELKITSGDGSIHVEKL
jgi:Cu/Ag efflux protein CusF